MNAQGLAKKAEKHLMQGAVKQQNRGGDTSINVRVLLNPKARLRWNVPKLRVKDNVLIGADALILCSCQK